MSKKEGAAPLRAVPEGEAEAPLEPTTSGLTPPTKKAGSSRFISDVIVEMGFLPRERVDVASRGQGSGRSRAGAARDGRDHRRPARRARGAALRPASHRSSISDRRKRAQLDHAAGRAPALARAVGTGTRSCWWPCRIVERARTRRPQADDGRRSCRWWRAAGRHRRPDRGDEPYDDRLRRSTRARRSWPRSATSASPRTTRRLSSS